jgi:hypothetical protein
MLSGISKRSLAATAVAATFILCGGPASAELLWVAADTGEEGAGTVEQPFSSIRTCLENARPGDTCQLRAGRYHEIVRLNGLRGQTGKPITLAAAPGEVVVLDGTLPLAGPWGVDETLENGAKVWTAKAPAPMWQIFKNDRAMEIARFPNAQFDEPEYWLQQEAWRHMTPASTPGIAIDERPEGEEGVAPPVGNHQSLADIDADLTGAVAIMNIASWITVAQTVANHEPGSDRFTYSTDFTPMGEALGKDVQRMLSRPGWWEKKNQKNEQAYYVLVAHRALLDEAGEWHYDRETGDVFVALPDGEVPDDHRISGKVTDYVIDLQQASHVELRGFRVIGGSFRVADSDHVTIRDNKFIYPSYGRWVLGDMHPVRPFTVSGSAKAMQAGGSQNRVINNTILRPDGPGLWIEGKKDLVENNLVLETNIHCVGPLLWSAMSMIKAEDLTFRYNTVHRGGCSSGINIGPRTLAEMNIISGTGMMQHDGSVFHTVIPSQTGTLITRNWVTEARRGGIRFDAPINGSRWGHGGSVVRNVVWKAEKSMIKGEDHFVANNTAFDNLMADLTVLNNPAQAGHNKRTIVANNLARLLSGGARDEKPLANDSGGNRSGVDIRQVLHDPDNLDFRPRDPSLIDTGMALESVSFVGDGPDIGAYEAGNAEYWIPGRRAGQATMPVPPNGSETVKSDADLMFRPAYEAVGHQVYFGRDGRLKSIAKLGDGNIADPGLLEAGQTYLWRVDASRADGSTVEGKLWSFTVGADSN